MKTETQHAKFFINAYTEQKISNLTFHFKKLEIWTQNRQKQGIIEIRGEINERTGNNRENQ